MQNQITFNEAKKLVSILGITSFSQFLTMQQSGMLPVAMPKYPEQAFRGMGWTKWENFLSETAQSATQLDYTNARFVVSFFGFRVREDYRAAKKNNVLLTNLIPYTPERTYKGEYKSFKDFTSPLTRDVNAAQNILKSTKPANYGVPQSDLHNYDGADFMYSIQEFKQLLSDMNIKSKKDFQKSAELKSDLSVPANPVRYYQSFQWEELA